MAKRRSTLIAMGGLVLLGSLWLMSCAPKDMGQCTQVPYEPNITPDYTGLVIPPNIAPLNFQIRESGKAYRARVHAAQGPSIEICSKTGRICIPRRKWQTLLTAARGQDIHVDIYVRDENQQWRQFKRIRHTIAPEPIDNTLVYRFMKPVYKWWKDMAIYQRDLSTHRSYQIMHNRAFGGGCINCHSFAANAPNTMTIDLRSAQYGSHTLLAHNGTVAKIGAKWGYTAWHPSGELAVYSMNKVRQFFHVGGAEVRDVVDLDSALACYRVDEEEVVCPQELARKDRLETYPTWSADGKYLYYCSAPILWQDRNALPPENFDQLKYDLRRIAYDVQKDLWGPAETVLTAAETGLSILLPRVSPDGRFLLFCMCQYGCFPIYQPSSDLYIMDLATRQYHKLAVNSPYAESWHSWSSNSRWIAFSSKRQGGLLTRTYLSYIDQNGHAHRAFVLPQADPTYYDTLLETYSVPELVKDRVKVSKPLLARMARSAPADLLEIPITGATPSVEKVESWQVRE